MTMQMTLPNNAPNLGFLLHEVARLLRKRFVQYAKGCGLTRSQWQVLAYLAQNEGINQTGLAELLDIEPITLGRLVDKLQAMGLVERRPDRSDRRVWLLHSTPAAASQLAHLRALGDLTRAEALAGVSEDERDYLVRLLQLLKVNLTEACNTPAKTKNADQEEGQEKAGRTRADQTRTSQTRTSEEKADLERAENV